MQPYGSDQMDPKIRSDLHNSSHCWNVRGKGGDIRSQHQNSRAKRAGRRAMKRLARAAGKAECKAE